MKFCEKHQQRHLDDGMCAHCYSEKVRLETPRTDALYKEVPETYAFRSPITTQSAWAEFAKRLERENAMLLDALEREQESSLNTQRVMAAGSKQAIRTDRGRRTVSAPMYVTILAAQWQSL